MRLTTQRPAEAVDVVLALALTAAGQLEIWAPHLVPGVSDDVTGARPVLAVTTAAITLPLIARRRTPLLVLGCALAAAALQQALTTPTQGLAELASLMVAAYAATAYSTGRAAVALSGAFVLVGSALVGDNLADHAFLFVLLGAAALAGLAIGERTAQVARLTDDNRALAVRLAEAARLLQEAERRGKAVGGPAPDELAALTSRELEVVRAIATGRSNAEIAEVLVISEWTVKTHVASILRKLGLRDRAQVVVAAYEARLVQPRPDGN